MSKRVSLLAFALLFATTAAAADRQTKAERDRQISEIVFQNYPPRALAAKEQGAVFFVVKLDKDARATSCEVTHGSGHPMLDAETCELIVQHAVFKSARNAEGHVSKQTAEGVVNWRIPGQPPVAINPVLLAAKGKPQRQICKKNLRMGTLSSVERICMTESEWSRQRDDMLTPWDEVQGRKGSTNCNLSTAAGSRLGSGGSEGSSSGPC